MPTGTASSTAHRLLAHTPPGLRSEIARRVFLSPSALPPPLPRHFGTTTPRSARPDLASRNPLTCQRSCVEAIRREPSRRHQSTTINNTLPSPDQPNPPPSHSDRKPARARPYLVNTAFFALFLALGLTMAAAPAAETLAAWANPPSDAETLLLVEARTPESAALEARLTNHALAVSTRARPDMTESRPHMKIPAAARPHNLTAGVLMGAGGLEVPPLTFVQRDAALPEMVQLLYFGPALCGHPGIVHGGLLATMLDEGLARCCFPALPNKVGVTASLKIDYRVPCPAGRMVVLKAFTTKVEGRKAWVKGWIELLDDEGGEGEGVKIVEAEALFIEPKQAKHLARIST